MCLPPSPVLNQSPHHYLVYVQPHLAKSASTDAAACYLTLAAQGIYDAPSAFHHNCVLSCKRSRVGGMTPTEIGDLRMLGVGADSLMIKQYNVAHILGVHFRAGQWGQRPFCGSVITCVINGRSVYGCVVKFLKVVGDDSPGYASVVWFGEPQYPSRTPLVVRVGRNGRALKNEIGSMIPITQIDPSCVVVEAVVGGQYYMMRQSGYDTRHREQPAWPPARRARP